jgi:hypothetical protein
MPTNFRLTIRQLDFTQSEKLLDRVEHNCRKLDELTVIDKRIDGLRETKPKKDSFDVPVNKVTSKKTNTKKRLGNNLSADIDMNLLMYAEEKELIRTNSADALIGTLMLHKEELTKLAPVNIDQRRSAAMYLFARPRAMFKPVVGSAWHICQSLGIDPMIFQTELLTEMFNSRDEQIIRWAKVIFFFMQTNPEMLYDTAHKDGRIYEDGEFSNLLFEMFSSREEFMQEVDFFISKSKYSITLKVNSD